MKVVMMVKKGWLAQSNRAQLNWPSFDASLGDEVMPGPVCPRTRRGNWLIASRFVEYWAGGKRRSSSYPARHHHDHLRASPKTSCCISGPSRTSAWLLGAMCCCADKLRALLVCVSGSPGLVTRSRGVRRDRRRDVGTALPARAASA